ncbi:Na/Pi cotransporter family protein [Sungkyunkwania multivorans]|uniref:Na/Pi cotransporter family protein n=1 Tax=Sungkyunkwania multivorans TaxID=1173618 RepID=A0ABW3CZ12_9FLAO
MNYGFTDILTLLGALGLFLYGMKVMSDSLMEAAGDRMRNILASMTSNRVFAVFTGFVITAAIQSSSATTLMVVSFVNASLLTLTEAVGVILGANIGTTVTAWLITLLGFKVSMSAIALPVVALGFLLTFSKNIKTKHWGNFIVGFAVLFIGLQFLKDAVPNIQDSPEVLSWLQNYTDKGFWSVLIFLCIGTVLTIIIQSSSATMALTLVMCHEGWIPFDMAAAMVLGENIGTTITANLAALVANYNAKRAARAHLISQVLGVIWMLALFYPFLNLIDYITQNEGVSAFDSPLAIPVALSAFHTAFNMTNMLVLIGFVPLIVKIVERAVPYKEMPEPAVDVAKYLSKASMRYPQTAIKALIDESKRLYEGPVFKIVAHVLNIHRTDIKSGEKIKKLVKSSTGIVDIDVNEIYYKKVKHIYSEIIAYATRAQTKFSLTEEKMNDINKIKVANRKMVEIIKDADALNENMIAYAKTDNSDMHREYNRLRQRITKTLRRIYLANIDKSSDKHIKKLERIRKAAEEEEDVLASGTLNMLLQEKRITSEMASSLSIDSHLVKNIIKNLVAVAELLYVQSDTLLESFILEDDLQEAVAE